MADQAPKDGGPAFPATVQGNGAAVQVGNNAWREPGMSQRAYFAARALEGLLACPDNIATPSDERTPDGLPAPFYARIAVAYADALLAELAKAVPRG